MLPAAARDRRRGGKCKRRGGEGMETKIKKRILLGVYIDFLVSLSLLQIAGKQSQKQVQTYNVT